MKPNLIYGKHAVEEFLNKHPKMIKFIYVKNINEFENNQNINEFNIKVIKKNEIDLNKMFDEVVNHQNVIAEVKEYNYKPFGEIKNKLATRETDLILILDQIHDPYNFGAIIRSATLLGVKNIVIMDHKQVMVTPTVVKTSAGTVYDLEISKVSNLNNVIAELKKQGYWIYSSNLNKNAQDIRDVDFAQKTALIIGNEQYGVSDLLTKNSDLNIFIPSTKIIDSYNVSVATGILLYEIGKKIKLF
ncbi:23S rRNA (guanosine(2251)-2'-O)-methyltransferase RlmB [Williamsoniiplasma luminosum]|uniref:23S rRNA (Guanosine(2251)-2'-O)-methyltransferase RlmB n=1 Tax=Williamsoniiplasma luminosum TaxID=214888 RepID=A0A2S0NKI7_9MOLU|nr:23S rRNA (guanosine(2251)-2'-O)-methyltransferase RlmB [Williamsoniiplasma luminosum]AVP49530.1 MAG: 23S rRNA (guanosine(2251)-2'-O)-methyltransferase RlmB [Williamsoniiplasma luminosum]